MRGKTMKIRILVIIALVLAPGISAFGADDPFVGTWKLNPEKSTGTGNSPQSQILAVTARDNGLKFDSHAISWDGKSRHSQWIQIFNGEFRPDAAILNREVAYIRIDAHTIERIIRVNGKEAGRGRTVISQDGRTMTGTQRVMNAQGEEFESITIYEKQ
jgi:hypothetical protein